MIKINYLFAGLAGSLLLFSCGENNAMKKIKEAQEGLETVSEIVSASSNVTKDMQDLSELQPLAQKDFEDWMPGESFRGMKRTRSQVGGVSSIEPSVRLFYQDESNATHYLEIDVADGADAMGSMLIAQINMFLKSDVNLEKSGVIERTVDKKGYRAMETVGTESNINTIVTVHDGRFYVKVSGREVDMDDLWNALEALNLDKLGK